MKNQKASGFLLSLVVLLGFTGAPHAVGQDSDKTFSLSIYERTLPVATGPDRGIDSSFLLYSKKFSKEMQNPLTGKMNQSTYYYSPGTCTDSLDVNCKANPYGGVLFLDLCNNGAIIFCVEGVTYNSKPLTFEMFTSNVQMKSNASTGFPGGRSVSIWRSANGERFALFPMLALGGDSSGIRYNYFTVSLEKVTFTDAEAHRIPWSITKNSDNLDNVSFPTFGTTREDCFEYLNSGRCIERSHQLTGTFSVSLHVAHNSVKWVTGRLTDAQIKVTNVDNSTDLISVVGKPSSVTEAQIKLDAEQTDKYWTEQTRGLANPTQPSWPLNFELDNELALYNYYMVTKFGEPVPRNTKDIWKFGSTLVSETQCFRPEVGYSGFAMTNALIHTNLNPTILNGNFEYQISAPHLNQFGEENIGIYQLEMSNQLARCLYHLSNAPIQASVVVTDDNGNRKVATTTVNQNSEKIFIEARNFTFSSPIIKVKITQATSPKKEISINCYKGKTVKTVKGANPKCPAGYKTR